MLLSFTALPTTILATEGDGEGSLDTNISSEDGDVDADADADAEGSVESDDGETKTEAEGDIEGSVDTDEGDAETDAEGEVEGSVENEDDEDDKDEENKDVQTKMVNKLELSSSKSDVMVGENMMVNVKGWDKDGNIIENMDDIQFSVDNNSVATINSNGELVPKTSGNVTVTVSAGDVSEEFTFNVKAKAHKEDDDDEDSELNGDLDGSLNLTADDRKVTVGEDLQLNWNGDLADENVSFELSNNSKASINDNGKLTAKSPGKLTVWLKTDDGNKTKLDLMIHPEAKADMDMENLDTVKLDVPKTNVNLNETLPLDLDGFDLDGNKWEQMGNVEFSVDDESKATIDANGNLHPKAEGTVTITANVNGKTDSMDIMIDNKEIDGIDLNAPKGSIGVNEKLNLNVDGTDEDGIELSDLRDVEFKVSDNSIATIDGEGNLIPKAEGTVKVWAMLDGKQDSFTVNITGDAKMDLDEDLEADLDEMNDISLSAPKADLNVNEKLKLNVDGLDEDGNSIGNVSDVWFDVSDEDIAEITEDGYLIPKAEGTVTVTANANGETDTFDVNVDDAELSDVSFDTPEAEVDMDGNMKLKVNGSDENGNELEDLQNVDFEVSDESVATVDSEGNITPMSEGTVTVTASSDNYEDEMTLTVADNGNNTGDTETTLSNNDSDWNSSDEDSSDNWTSSSDMSNDSSNSNWSNSPGVPTTGDGSSQQQNSMAWSWIALGLMSIAGASIFAWRKQYQA